MTTSSELKNWIDANWAGKADKISGDTNGRPTTCNRDTIYFDTETQKVTFWIKDTWIDLNSTSDIKQWLADRVDDNTDSSTGSVYKICYTDGRPYMEEVDPSWANPGTGNSGSIDGFAPIYDTSSTDTMETDELRRMKPTDIKTISTNVRDSLPSHNAGYSTDSDTIRKYSNLTIKDLIERYVTSQYFEPAFTKQSAFNKSFGYSSSDVARGDHNHEGQWESSFTKNTAFNKDFGTTSNTVSEGNHAHNYEPSFSKGTGFNKNFGEGATDVATGDHSHIGGWEVVTSGSKNSWAGLNEIEYGGCGRGYEVKVEIRVQGGNPASSSPNAIQLYFNSANDSVDRYFYEWSYRPYVSTSDGGTLHLIKDLGVGSAGSGDISTHAGFSGGQNIFQGYSSDAHTYERIITIKYTELGDEHNSQGCRFTTDTYLMSRKNIYDGIPLNVRFGYASGHYHKSAGYGEQVVNRIYISQPNGNDEFNGVLNYKVSKRRI